MNESLHQTIQTLVEDQQANSSLPPQIAPITYTSVAESLAGQTEPPKPLVDRLIQPGEVVGLGAGRNIGKSWFCLQLSQDIASGGEFLGTFKCHVSDRPVLISHGEMNQTGAVSRWKKLDPDSSITNRIFETFEPFGTQIAKSVRWLSETERVDVTRAILDGRIETMLSELQPSAWFIDPWKVFYRGPENDNDATSEALIMLFDLAARYDTAIVFSHHLSKGSDVSQKLEPEDAWRGASVLADRVHTRITLAPRYDTLAKANAAAKRAGIEPALARKWARRYANIFFQTRNGEMPDSFSVAWSPETGRWNRWEPPAEEANEDGVSLAQRQRAEQKKLDEFQFVMANARPRKGNENGGFASMRDAELAFGCGNSQAKRLLAVAVQGGGLTEVKATEKGKSTYYVLREIPGSPKGRK